MKIDTKSIKELAELLEETGLSEIEVADGGKSIRVSKGGTTIVSPSAAPATMTTDPAAPGQANTNAPDTTASTHPGAITSPMVGTIYLAPEPDSPNFVEKGATVKAGDTLLIIEAMKVMNQIKAEKGGTVTHIQTNNGDPVEFGDVLMIIE